MVLGGFDNTLKNLSTDASVMSNGNSFNVVRDLMTIVNSVQSLAGAVANSHIHDMLAMSLMGKISELESIITMFGPQRLTSFGISAVMPNPMMGGGMQPVMPGMQMHNQSFYYPTMGQQQAYAGGMQYQQPAPAPMTPPTLQAMPQPIMPPPAPPIMDVPPVPAAPAAPTAPAPTAAAPAPVTAPTSAAPAPAAPSGPDIDVSSAIAKGGALPGMSLPGAGNDKPALGRDYILKLLEER